MAEPTPRPLTIVSDLDDTVIPTDRSIDRYLDSVYGGLANATGLSRKAIVGAHAEMILQHGFVTLGDHLNEVPLLAKAYPGEDLNRKFAPEMQAARDVYHASLKPKPEVLDFYRAAKAEGHRLILFTAASVEQAAERMTAADPEIRGLFEHVYTAPNEKLEGGIEATRGRYPGLGWEDVTVFERRPKKDPEHMARIMKEQGLDPRRTVMMGDNPVEDVLQAQRNGVRGVHVTWYSNDHKAHPLNAVQELRTAIADAAGKAAPGTPQPAAASVMPDLTTDSPAELARRLNGTRAGPERKAGLTMGASS